jgi:preprotein translocase subunit SecG
MSLAINIFTFILILVSLFLVLVVLMQRAKTDGGMGAAMGGGSMESTFGADTSNVLSTATIRASVVFFVLTFGLYLANIYQTKKVNAADGKLPTVVAPAAAPAAAPVTAPTLPQPATSQPVEAAKK